MSIIVNDVKTGVWTIPRDQSDRYLNSGLDATKDNVEYIFGKAVESFEQDENQVVAHFSDGTSDTFDLLVGADGQGSRIR